MFRRKNFFNAFYGVAFIFLAVVQSGCSGSTTATSSTANGVDSTSNTSQAAMAESNNQAQASESSTAVAFMDEEAIGDRPSGFDFDSSSITRPFTASACTYSTVRGTCTSSVDTITWGGCTVDGGNGVMTGSWTETFTGTSSASCTVPVVSGETVVRTTAGSTLTASSGASAVTDTNGGTAWDNTVIPATGSTVVNSSGTRTVTVNGTHKVGKGAAGVTLYDHFITTPTPLTMTGTRAAGTRTITGGSMKVYHNLAKYSATLAFNGVTWGSSTCCYPTAGTITGTLTGSITGTTVLTFSSTCGSATYQDTTATSGTALTLTQCM